MAYFSTQVFFKPGKSNHYFQVILHLRVCFFAEENFDDKISCFALCAWHSSCAFAIHPVTNGRV